MSLNVTITTEDGTVAARVLHKLADHLDGRTIGHGWHGDLWDDDGSRNLVDRGSWGFLADDR